jgi:hypothetical protein
MRGLLIQVLLYVVYNGLGVFQNGYYKDSKEVTGRQARRRREKGRSRLRWIEDTESDLRNVGVKRWRTRALD